MSNSAPSGFPTGIPVSFTAEFAKMIAAYQSNSLWPINSPVEIRVTALADPTKIVTGSSKATSR